MLLPHMISFRLRKISPWFVSFINFDKCHDYARFLAKTVIGPSRPSA